MSDELWNEVRDIVQETGIKTIPMEKKCKKAKWLSGEALQIACTTCYRAKQNLYKFSTLFFFPSAIIMFSLPDYVCSVTQSCPTYDPMDCSPPRLLCPWDFPGKTTRVGCHFLLQGIVLTQGWNPYFLPWWADS